MSTERPAPTSAERRDKFTLALLPVLASLIGVWLGGYITQRNALLVARAQRQQEAREHAYARLMGLKLAWVQAERGQLEAKLAAAYHLARWQRTHEAHDLEEAKLARNEASRLVDRLAEVQRELFQTLGEARTSFDLTPELDAAIGRVYAYKAGDIDVSRATGAGPEELERLRRGSAASIQGHLDKDLLAPVEELLPLMLAQLRTAK